MTCHKVDIILIIPIHTTSFRDDVSYEFVILFKLAFLVRNIRITVEYIGSSLAIIGLFYVIRILKFRTVVRIILNSV
ncbi:MAG: hypothetical protein K5669_02600 [Lachnospiraceae bacterium]|nr:hypothetical protein [Lachnospiraceae bacterium]